MEHQSSQMDGGDRLNIAGLIERGNKKTAKSASRAAYAAG
jgi:hypothetical protein